MTQLAQPTKHLSRAEDIFSYPGELISFGQSDSYSEIRGDIPITRNITFILNAIQFVTSGNHSFILTEQNHVYAFGSNTQKQLGTGATKQSNTPQIVEYLLPVKIIKIAVGAYHSLFLSQEGQVYVCGADPSTIIGGRLDNATFLPLPTILVLPAPAIDIHSGMFHCFAQLSTNRVMAWVRLIQILTRRGVTNLANEV
jgi:alpha-tubulin suppressor-like RCC1 family protein